jgi:hypothetical protein
MQTAKQSVALSYDASLAADLVVLGTFVNQPMTSDLLPNGWKQAFKGNTSAGNGAAQYLFATKNVNIDGQSQKVCALVLGAPWNKFLPYYIPAANHVLFNINKSILGDHINTDATVDLGFSQMYQGIRDKLWTDLQKVKDKVPGFDSELPVFVVGLGPGAPMAQLAAIDIRPDKEPVDDAKPTPVTELANYTFSTVAFGNSEWPPLVARLVSDCYRVQAPGDHFPGVQKDGSDYHLAGKLEATKPAIPHYDAPWFEREAFYYANLLTNQSINNGEADNGSVSNPPANFNSPLAFNLGRLVAVTYQQYQNPGTAPAFNFRPYDNKQYFGSSFDDQAAWFGVFEGPSFLVVTCRGSVTWDETLNNVCNAKAGPIPWVPETPPGSDERPVNYGQYSQPQVELYDEVRILLRKKLNELADLPVLVTGHSDGGTMANLVALDLKINPLDSKRTVNSIYTFGALPGASLGFLTPFENAFTDNNFQVVRPADVMPKIQFPFGLFGAGDTVILDGGPFNNSNGSTNHALSGYLNLLDPSS